MLDRLCVCMCFRKKLIKTFERVNNFQTFWMPLLDIVG